MNIGKIAHKKIAITNSYVCSKMSVIIQFCYIIKTNRYLLGIYVKVKM
jgi:hypothetical protein